MRYNVFGTYDYQFQLSIDEDGTVQKRVQTYLSNHQYLGKLSFMTLLEIQHQIELIVSLDGNVSVDRLDENQYFSELLLPEANKRMSWQGGVVSLPLELKKMLFLLSQIQFEQQKNIA